MFCTYVLQKNLSHSVKDLPSVNLMPNNVILITYEVIINSQITIWKISLWVSYGELNFGDDCDRFIQKNGLFNVWCYLHDSQKH